jgi:cell division protein FtsQ
VTPETGPTPPNRRVSRTSLPGPDVASTPAARSPSSGPDDAVPVTSAVAADADRARLARAGRGAGAVARRWLRRFQLVTGILVVVSASLLVAWGLRRYLRQSPRFAVRAIEVEGHHRLTAPEIAKLAGVERGMNVFALDEQLAAHALSADPWIERATVTRELPGTVRIRVTEREARALAAVDGRLYLVDAGGEIFKQRAEGDPSDLPVVTGMEGELWAKDREAARVRMRRALELAAEIERVGIAARLPIEELHLESDGSLAVVVGSDGVELQLGRPPYRAKIERLERILVELRERKAQPAVVYLDNEAHAERVVVRLR